MNISKVVFWQPTPSIHQNALVRALAERSGLSVTYVSERGIDESRQAMGWGLPDFGSARTIIAPPRDRWLELIDSLDSPRTAHLVSCFGCFPLSRLSGLRLIARGAKCGVYAEIPNSVTRKGIFRVRKIVAYLRDRVRSRYLLWRDLDYVLAVGDLGASWYRNAGFLEANVFSFGYFIEPAAGDSTRQLCGVSVFRICFVGQLVGRKGVDNLFGALAQLMHLQWVLDLVGDGPQRRPLESMADQTGIAGRIVWHGSLANPRVRRIMAASDAFVLPSYDDGWGAVVGEALLHGVPVVVTDACGSEVLVRSSGYGEVAPARDYKALAAAIERVVNQGKPTKERRAKIQDWARATISGEAGASYLLGILNHKYGGMARPKPPWECVSGALCR